MKIPTRDKIIEAATALITRYGFNYTGISQILKEIQVPKGSFYHYFESKEALGYAVIEKAGQDHFQKLDDYFNSARGTPLNKIKAFFQYTVDQYDIEADYGCILGNLGQELAQQHPGYRQRLAQIFSDTELYFARLFEDAKSNGELSKKLDNIKLAEFLFTSWEGAVLCAKVKKSKRPLENFLQIIFDIMMQS
jgi:TetR/AcrR family transcriptional repressor of nem operon